MSRALVLFRFTKVDPFQIRTYKGSRPVHDVAVLNTRSDAEINTSSFYQGHDELATERSATRYT